MKIFNQIHQETIKNKSAPQDKNHSMNPNYNQSRYKSLSEGLFT